jgi:hypothetical protein
MTAKTPRERVIDLRKRRAALGVRRREFYLDDHEDYEVRQFIKYLKDSMNKAKTD